MPEAVRRPGAVTAGMEGRPRRAADARAVRPGDDPEVLAFDSLVADATSTSTEAVFSPEPRCEEKKTSTGRELRAESAFVPVDSFSAGCGLPAFPEEVEVFTPDDAFAVDFCVFFAPEEDFVVGDPSALPAAAFSLPLPCAAGCWGEPSLVLRLFLADEDVLPVPLDVAAVGVLLSAVRRVERADPGDVEDAFPDAFVGA